MGLREGRTWQGFGGKKRQKTEMGSSGEETTEHHRREKGQGFWEKEGKGFHFLDLGRVLDLARF